MGKTFAQGSSFEGLFEDGIRGMVEEVAQVETDHGFWDPTLDGGSDDVVITISRGELRRLKLIEKIALMHSELSELLEVMRKNPQAKSEKVPELYAYEDEAADVLIRLLGFCKRMGIRLGLATVLKNRFNITRPYMHGKKF